jgi:hypothetical protein
VNTSKLSPANIVILAAGALMLIGSFLAFYKFSIDVFDATHTETYSAWSSGLFGIATVIVICGIIMAGQVALSSFGSNVSIPDKVLGFGWDQIHLVLGFQAAIMMIAFLITSRGTLSLGIGFWLMLIAGIGLFVGAIMRVAGAKSNPFTAI